VGETRAQVRRAELLEARDGARGDALHVIDACILGHPAELAHHRLSRGRGVVAAPVEKLGELEELHLAPLGQARALRVRTGGPRRRETPPRRGFDEPLAHLGGAPSSRMTRARTMSGRREGDSKGVARLEGAREPAVRVLSLRHEGVELRRRAIPRGDEALLELDDALLGALAEDLRGAFGRFLGAGQETLDHGEGRRVEPPRPLPLEVAEALVQMCEGRHLGPKRLQAGAAALRSVPDASCSKSSCWNPSCWSKSSWVRAR
jgi:hypothetical protein